MSRIFETMRWFSVMEACRQKGRTFLGCDING